jgi:hypothetical protein
MGERERERKRGRGRGGEGEGEGEREREMEMERERWSHGVEENGEESGQRKMLDKVTTGKE